jgi:hypothetical protein
MGDWRSWVTQSAAAVRVTRGVCAVASVGLATAAALVLGTLAFDRSLGPTGVLLVTSFPVVFAGQAWVVAVQTARGSDVIFSTRRPRSFFRVRVPVFASLPVWCTYGFVAVALLAWVAAMASWPSLLGHPTSSAPGCPYRLVSHGDFTCVSRATYLHVGAAEERFAAGIAGFFFAFHLTMSAAELARIVQ